MWIVCKATDLDTMYPFHVRRLKLQKDTYILCEQ